MCIYPRIFRLPIKQLVFAIFQFLTSGSVQFWSGSTYQSGWEKNKNVLKKQQWGGNYSGPLDCLVIFDSVSTRGYPFRITSKEGTLRVLGNCEQKGVSGMFRSHHTYMMDFLLCLYEEGHCLMNYILCGSQSQYLKSMFTWVKVLRYMCWYGV